MALRDMVGTAAKMTAGFWTEVARAVDPPLDRDPVGPQPTAAEAAPKPTPEAAPTPTPEALDGVLVPVDTWDRVMDQLGNLHEAGQQLAEARERAAKAETQVEFLREQLAEARARPRPRPRAPKPETPAPEARGTPDDPPTPQTVAADARSGRRVRVRNARNRVSGWLRTD